MATKDYFLKPRPRRLTLTKAQLSADAGRGLLDIVCRITADGRVSGEEVGELRAWLKQARTDFADVPPIAALRDVVENALADGTLTNEERSEIVEILLRILPADERRKAKARVDGAKPSDTQVIPRIWPKSGRSPATEGQRGFMRTLRIDFDEHTITKAEAIALIDRKLNSSRDVSNRQMMVLRFWDKVALANRGKRWVSTWMDRWYEDDPRRIAAWERWKAENGDRGLQSDPTVVPIGAGYQILDGGTVGPRSKLRVMLKAAQALVGDRQPGTLAIIGRIALVMGVLFLVALAALLALYVSRTTAIPK